MILAVQAALLLALALAPAPSQQASVPAGGQDAHEATDAPLVPGLRLQHGRLRYVPPPPPANVLSNVHQVETLYFEEQVLDHFNPIDKRVWKQRYFARDDLYEEGGPAFIYIGGEGQEAERRLADGALFMTYLARIYKAKLFDLEHRYYGYSHPTPDLSSANLQYLSADQALADLAYFIEYLIKKGDLKEGQKVAVFGGSYPGNLAAWARLKYPHLIHAAVSSSAPVHAEADYVEYMEVVSRSLARVAGQWCDDNVKKGFDRIKKLLLTTDGLTTIQNTFYMCDPPNTANKLDMDIFYEIIANPFAGASQYNRDGNSQYSLKAQCQYMAGDLTEDEAVTALGNVFYASQGWIFGCIDWSYKTNTKYLSDVSYSDGSRQWVYMTCAMFGYFQTADGDTVFPKGYFDVPYFVQQCKDAFGENYNDAMVKKGVERTNTVFGSWNPDVENVMFVNGKIDPWHALSVLEDVNDKSPAVLISSTSHCYDMYANDAGDSAELRAARDKIKQFVTNALYEGTNGDSPTLSP